jgi:hypothetical protein
MHMNTPEQARCVQCTFPHFATTSCLTSTAANRISSPIDRGWHKLSLLFENAMAVVHAHGTGAEMYALDAWTHLSSVASMTAPEPAGNAFGGPGAPSLKF